jgi:hypothetical protein
MKSNFRFRAVAIYSILGTLFVLIAAHLVEIPERRHNAPPQRRRGGGGNWRGVAEIRRMQRNPERNQHKTSVSVHADYPIRKQFDKDDNRILDATERQAAREFLQKERDEGRGPRRGRFFGGRGESTSAPGKQLTPSDVQTFGDEPLYDLFTLRTFFLEFESADWERELDDFYHTDAEVPAKLTVDGKSFADVGVHFHGASSYSSLQNFGQKASLGLSMDMAHEKQELLGYRTVDLLNSHADPSFLHTVLYLQIARDYIPAPKANLARVVIDGENWGIYVNTEHFNKDFVHEWFPKSKGARWKVPGSPRAHAGLEYLGEDVDAYRRIYEIKTKDENTSWRQLIHLCRVLCETPSDQLESELNKVLDVDGTLKFLALQNTLIDNNGYWSRASDYNLCQDQTGRFHIIPHDANETFSPPERRGSDRSPNSGEPNVTLDPATGSEDPSKPLLNRLLAVKNLRARYFGYVRQIAEQSLDWNKLGPIAAKYHKLIAEDVKADTKKLDSYEEFEASLGENPEPNATHDSHLMNLKTFIEKRRAFLLDQPEVKKASMPLAAN